MHFLYNLNLLLRVLRLLNKFDVIFGDYNLGNLRNKPKLLNTILLGLLLIGKLKELYKKLL